MSAPTSPAATTPIRVERRGDVALLTLDRVHRRNALDDAAWRALGDEVRALSKAPPRVLVVTGAGGHFCAGMDLQPDNPLFAKIAASTGTGDPGAARAVIVELKSHLRPLLETPMPVIAAVEGACIGGGLEVALHCDLLVAAEDSRWGLPETRVGLMADLGGTVLLRRRVSLGGAALLALAGETWSGEEAHRRGLCDVLVPSGQALARALALAEAITWGGPVATRETLARLRRVPSEQEFQAETEAGARVVASGELVTGIAAFLGKRKPTWGGPA